MKRIIPTIAVAIATLPLFAYDPGDEMAATASDFTFQINTKDGAAWSYVADGVADFPVTWRKGETVTVTDKGGNEASGYPATAAASDGSQTFSPAAGGMWTLVNSESGTAYIVAPWGQDEIGTTIATSAALSDIGVDTVQTSDNGTGGIDRNGKKREFPGYVAFSGDDWVGESSETCSLRFTAPDSAVTTVEKTGTGAYTFTFDKAGVWTIELVVDGTTVRTAHVNAILPGLIIIFY